MAASSAQTPSGGGRQSFKETFLENLRPQSPEGLFHEIPLSPMTFLSRLPVPMLTQCYEQGLYRSAQTNISRELAKSHSLKWPQ